MRRNPCQRLRSFLVAFCSRDTSLPYNQARASRGKTFTGFAEGGHRNGPLNAALPGGQAEDLEKTGSMGIQGDRQHEPESFQGGQLATTFPLFFLPSSSFEHGHEGGVEPLCKCLQIRFCHGYPPWNR